MHYCGACGARSEGDVRFCTECGHDLHAPETLPAASGDGTVPSAAPWPPAAPVTPIAPVTPLAPAAPAAATSGTIMRNRVLLLAGIALVFAMVGVAAGFALPQDEPGEIVGNLPVGPEGASVEFDDGKGSLRVPKGALDEPERIIIRRTIIRERVRANVPGGIPMVFPPGTVAVYIFGPTTLVFNRPVTIILPLPNPAVPGIIFVFANGQIRFLGGTINADAGTIRIRTSSFAFASFAAVGSLEEAS